MNEKLEELSDDAIDKLADELELERLHRAGNQPEKQEPAPAEVEPKLDRMTNNEFRDHIIDKYGYDPI